MSSMVEKYSGKVTLAGSSKCIRLNSAFFKAHPEFAGDVRATVIANGQVLLSAGSDKKAMHGKMDDPVLFGFLGFLEAQMASRPGDIAAADTAQLARIGRLVKDVKSD